MAPAVKERSRKSGRLEARVTPEMKEMFQEAADLEGLSLTDFYVRSVREAAQRVLREREIIELSQRDRVAFVNALLNPPPPSARLQSAAQRYKQVFGQ
jgi:uncharacterized protein (DUF1778 family)